MLTHPLVVQIRAITRRMGLNRLIGSWLSQGPYEDRFARAFNSAIHAGDIVWDVGANLGLYTGSSLQAAGPGGLVVAFEPVPECFHQLSSRFGSEPRVRLMNAALGEHDGRIAMALDTDPLAATHHVVLNDEGSLGTLMLVDVRSAASFVAENPALFPNIVKIDVEGHEGAVVAGLDPLLDDHRLHCVGIEVHFGLLAQRGESDCPRRLEQFFRTRGFDVRWTDASHLLATR